MKKIMFLLSVVATVAFCGCDNPCNWEFQYRTPNNLSLEKLMEIESVLTSNGYKRIQMKQYTEEGYITIRATKTEGEKQ